jgi:NADPH2:quinone reductase
MKAIRQYEFGPAENLRYEDVPDPEPAEGQVRVAVEAAGVHHIDTKIRQGISYGPPPMLPMTPGREIAGRVEALGSGVDSSWLGRRVVAQLGLASGGYAEKAVITATSLHEIPEQISASAAVASIGTGRTALVALDLAAVTDQDVVLVTAAASGMGNLLFRRLAGISARPRSAWPAARRKWLGCANSVRISLWTTARPAGPTGSGTRSAIGRSPSCWTGSAETLSTLRRDYWAAVAGS